MEDQNNNRVPGTIKPGETVGKYEIRDMLGAGGQSVVYRAWDAALEREVALKQMLPNLVADPRYAEQLRKTIRTIAQLGSKNEVIVTVYDLIEDDRGLFYAMEYVDGHSLELVLNDNPGPVEVKGVLLILFRLAAALHEIHGAGIIHRDLKPGNIMLAEGLRPKIIDFGVASIGDSDVSMPLVTTKYLAPELYEGGSCDSRADIYSLGFVAYEMLLGREKFNEVFADIVRDKGAEALRWMKWHGNVQVSAPPAHEVVPTVPIALSHIVQRMIEKDPDQRFKSTEELGRTIKRSFSGKGKRGPGAVAPAAQTQRSAMMARLAAERGLGRLEDEVDYTPGAAQDGGMGPATAPIPKEPMTKRRKVVLAVAVGIMFVGVIITVAIKMNKDAQTRQAHVDTAKDIYLEGKSSFDQGKYSEAVPKFKLLLEKHQPTIYAKYAEFLSPLAVGYHAHSTGRFDLARKSHSEAVTAIGRLQGTLKNRDEIDLVTGFLRTAEELQSMTVSSQLVFAALARARQAIPMAVGIKQLDVIEQTLRNEITSNGAVRPTKVESTKILAVYSDIRRRRYLLQLEEKIQAADRLVEQQAWDEAQLGYQEVEDYLTGDEGKEVLTEDERTDQIKIVRRKRNAISEHLGKEKIVSQIREAEASGDPQKMVMAYRMALTSEKISLDEKQVYQKRIDAIELKALVVEAQAALTAGQTAEAKRLFGEVLKKDPSNAIATQALNKLIAAQRTEALFKAAKQAVLDRNYAQGLSLLSKVAAFRQDDEVRSLTTECRYELEMAKARRAITTDDTSGALRYLAAAEQIDPTKAAQVGTIRSTIQSQKKYSELVTQIKASLKAEEWKRTLELITRARAIRDTQELKDFENRTHYGDLLASGKKAIDEGNKDTARWYFKRAQRFVDTPEIKRLLESVKVETPKTPE